jgi:hypothetical protein
LPSGYLLIGKYITLYTTAAMEGQGENDELYPIAVLIDELKVSTFLLVTASPSLKNRQS